MTHRRAAHASRASEAGFALLEVVVSAAVFAVVAVAVLAGIDGAQSSTGREKSRSVAANLAERDQERMRAMQVDTLADYTLTATENVDGNAFTVVSTGEWVRDATGGTVSCQNNSTQADYLQISSTVTSKTVGTNTKPVVIQSLVAPSVAYLADRGSLAVQVNDRDGVGVPGIAVAISGPASDSATTNASGCAVFEYIAIGNYNITLNRPGWVDHFGNTVSVGNQDVTSGTLNIRSMDYDRAASANATVRTYKPNSTTPVAGNELVSSALRFSATNSGEPGMQRLFTPTPATTPVNALNLTSLFPFKDEYGVFTGGCEEANPVVYDGDYFAPVNGFGGAVKTDPAGAHSVIVHQPPLNIRVRNTADSYASPINVLMTPRLAPGCTDESPYVMTTTTNPYATAGSTGGWPSKTATTFDPGLPFGRYNICLDYQVSSNNWRYYRPSATSANAYENIVGLGRGPTSLPTPLSTLTLPPSTSDWAFSSSRVCPTS